MFSGLFERAWLQVDSDRRRGGGCWGSIVGYVIPLAGSDCGRDCVFVTQLGCNGWGGDLWWGCGCFRSGLEGRGGW